MKVKIIMPEFEIHTTPLENVEIDSCMLQVCLNDINENRYKISAQPYQSIKITTIDCLSSQDYYHEFCFRNGRYHRHILQIEKSDLINELAKKTSDLQIL